MIINRLTATPSHVWNAGSVGSEISIFFIDDYYF